MYQLSIKHQSDMARPGSMQVCSSRYLVCGRGRGPDWRKGARGAWRGNTIQRRQLKVLEAHGEGTAQTGVQLDKDSEQGRRESRGVREVGR